MFYIMARFQRILSKSPGNVFHAPLGLLNSWCSYQQSDFSFESILRFSSIQAIILPSQIHPSAFSFCCLLWSQFIQITSTASPDPRHLLEFSSWRNHRDDNRKRRLEFGVLTPPTFSGQLFYILHFYVISLSSFLKPLPLYPFVDAKQIQTTS